MDPYVLVAAQEYVKALGEAEESTLPHSVVPAWETMSPAAQQLLLAAMRKAMIAALLLADANLTPFLTKIQGEIV